MRTTSFVTFGLLVLLVVLIGLGTRGENFLTRIPVGDEALPEPNADTLAATSKF